MYLYRELELNIIKHDAETQPENQMYMALTSLSLLAVLGGTGAAVAAILAGTGAALHLAPGVFLAGCCCRNSISSAVT